MLCRGSIAEVVTPHPQALHPEEYFRPLLEGERIKVHEVRDELLFYRNPTGETTFRIPVANVKEVPTVDAHGTIREELEAIRIVDDEWFVLHRPKGKILCYGVKFFSGEYFTLYRPVLFKSYTAADNWIKDGCMADLQESMGNLNVRFTDKLTGFNG